MKIESINEARKVLALCDNSCDRCLHKNNYTLFCPCDSCYVYEIKSIALKKFKEYNNIEEESNEE